MNQEAQTTSERLQKGGVETAIGYIQRDIAEINLKLDNKYVTKEEFSPVKAVVNDLDNRYIGKEEFRPVKNVVYGLVALILTAVIGAILTILLKK